MKAPPNVAAAPLGAWKLGLRALLGLAVTARALAVPFGPSGCVSISQSPKGSCVLTTDCEGQDTSKFEFAFDCETPNDGSIVRHSYGVGGFDVNEEFDSEVVCKRCMVPTGQPEAASKPQAAAPASSKSAAPSRQPASPGPQSLAGANATAERREAAARKEAPRRKAPAAAAVVPRPPQASRRAPQPPVAAAKALALLSSRRILPEPPLLGKAVASQVASAATTQPPPPAPKSGGESLHGLSADGTVHYGPRGCVSTYKSKEGHCILKTDCTEQDIEEYAFGLVCVDKVGAPVRHLFGKDSFDPKEEFDTLIPCDQCLGLEDIPDAVAVNGQVVSLAGEIKKLEQMMLGLTTNVERLNQKVFHEEPAHGPNVDPRVQQDPHLRGHGAGGHDAAAHDATAAAPPAPHAAPAGEAGHAPHHFMLKRRRKPRPAAVARAAAVVAAVDAQGADDQGTADAAQQDDEDTADVAPVAPPPPPRRTVRRRSSRQHPLVGAHAQMLRSRVARRARQQEETQRRDAEESQEDQEEDSAAGGGDAVEAEVSSDAQADEAAEEAQAAADAGLDGSQQATPDATLDLNQRVQEAQQDIASADAAGSGADQVQDGADVADGASAVQVADSGWETQMQAAPSSDGGPDGGADQDDSPPENVGGSYGDGFDD